MPKWLIVVLVAIAVLFAISLAAGSNQDGNSRSGFGQSLKGFRKTVALKLSDVTLGTGCARSGGLLAVTGTCVLQVGKAGPFQLGVREARLLIASGAGNVVLTPVDEVTQGPVTIEAANPTKLDFPRKGGQLTIGCFPSCTVRFAP